MISRLAGSITHESQQLRLAGSVIRLMRTHPFFGTLLYFAEPTVISEGPLLEVVKAVGTDGRKLYWNIDHLYSVDDREMDATNVHQVIHLGSRHTLRRKDRDRRTWQVAADISTNAVVAEEGYTVPWKATRNDEIEDLSVEEIYHLIYETNLNGSVDPEDLLGHEQGQNQEPQQVDENGQPLPFAAITAEEAAVLDERWRTHQVMAATAAREKGRMPAGMARILKDGEPKIPWKHELQNMLEPTQNDYGELDQMLLPLGIVTETLYSETLVAQACIDTSGSIGGQEMSDMVAELKSIMNLYPNFKIELYYADAAIYGPYELEEHGEFPVPRGGGGTDFRPFFKATDDARLRIYLTDGYGDFPQVEPTGQTLWVVVPGGLDNAKFPFGHPIRML